MPKGNHKPTHKTALVVLSDASNYHRAVDISNLQAAAIQQLDQIRLLQRESALRAVLCGFALHRIKASLKHGQFLPWIKSSLQGTGRSQANNYMRLAAIAVEKTRATKPELLALPGDQIEFSLDTAEGEARRMMDKLAKFVGDKSLNELLRAHGIKGDKLTLPASRAAATEQEAAPPDPELVAQTARENLSSWLATGQQILIEENLGQHLKPAELREIDTELARITAQFRKGHRSSLRTKARR